MGGFVEMFRLDPGGETSKDGQEEVVRPAWFGPPEDELGVSVPLAVVLGRSDKAVVALRHVTAYSTGVTFELVAAGRGLREVEAQRLFHEQHIADPDEGLPEGFLRVGIELANGRRISNLQDRRHLWGQPDQEPEGPVLMQSGGGGGSAGSGHVTMNPAYWLWPLPPSGTLHLFVEWPSLGIALSSADLDGQRDRRCGFELTTALERPRQKSRSPLTFQSSGFDHTTISRDPGAVNRVHDFRRHRRLGPRGPVAFPPI